MLGRLDGDVDIEIFLPHLLNGFEQLLDRRRRIGDEQGFGETFAIRVAGLCKLGLGAFDVRSLRQAEGDRLDTLVSKLEPRAAARGPGPECQPTAARIR